METATIDMSGGATCKWNNTSYLVSDGHSVWEVNQNLEWRLVSGSGSPGVILKEESKQ